MKIKLIHIIILAVILIFVLPTILKPKTGILPVEPPNGGGIAKTIF